MIKLSIVDDCLPTGRKKEIKGTSLVPHWLHKSLSIELLPVIRSRMNVIDSAICWPCAGSVAEPVRNLYILSLVDYRRIAPNMAGPLFSFQLQQLVYQYYYLLIGTKLCVCVLGGGRGAHVWG